MSSARSRARRAVMQALYQWEMSGADVREVEAQFIAEQDLSKADIPYFQALVHEIPAHLHEIDAIIAPLLDRPVRELDPVERAILRIGACELRYHPDIPFRVVINEGVELAKTFGAEQSHKYVNGVLDKVAHRLRVREVEKKSR